MGCLGEASRILSSGGAELSHVEEVDGDDRCGGGGVIRPRMLTLTAL